MTLWIILLTILVLAQGVVIRDLIDEVEAIKSWEYFAKITAMRINDEEKEVEE
jgi:hypothetical protein